MSQQPPERRLLTDHTTRSQSLSLAGSPQQQSLRHDPHYTHYQEGYLDQNPEWVAQQEQQASEFSLAGTFPHKVRWNRRGRKKSEPVREEDEEKEESEPAPQVVAAVEQHRLGQHGDVQEDEEEVRGDSNATTAAASAGQQPRALTHGEINPSQRRRRMDAFRPNGASLGDVADPLSDPSANERASNPWAVFRQMVQRPLGEWLGTTIMVFLGISGNLAVITSKYQAGTDQTMYWCWGFAVMLGIYISGGASGAFLNPALTIMLSVFRGFPAKRIPSYILAQVLGAFTGALLAFAIYKDAIYHLNGALVPESTGQYFYTQPQTWVSPTTAFFTEFLGKAVLGCSILALGDSGNAPPGAGMHALIIGLLVTTCTMAFGYNTHGCFNPARDLGPRLATMAVGYPRTLFTGQQSWWIWGPWAGTISGALFGGLVYDLCIFKGGESPVNYSLNQYRTKTMQQQQRWFRRFRKPARADDLTGKIEEGLAREAQVRGQL